MSNDVSEQPEKRAARKRWLLAAVAAVVLVVVAFGAYQFTSSGGQQQPGVTSTDVIGRWQTDDGSLVLEFTPAGETKYAFSTANFTNKGSGNTIIEKGRMLGPWEMNMRWWEMRLDGDTLSLVAEDGTEYTLHRAG